MAGPLPRRGEGREAPLPRRGQGRAAGDGARQPDVELLLARARHCVLRQPPGDRPRSRGHGPVGQAGRRPVRVCARAPRRRSRPAHHLAGPRQRHHARGARLGRDDRARVGDEEPRPCEAPRGAEHRRLRAARGAQAAVADRHGALRAVLPAAGARPQRLLARREPDVQHAPRAHVVAGEGRVPRAVRLVAAPHRRAALR